jgi:hypothetical protein
MNSGDHFATPNGIKVHILKYVDSDPCYSKGNNRLVALCGVTCGENDATGYNGYNSQQVHTCQRCASLKDR